MDIRYYDERYYLSKFGVYERTLINMLKEKYNNDKEEEKVIFSDLINDYNSYIKNVSKLIKEISLKNNSLSMSVIISLLIECGVFSYNEFNRENCDDIVDTKIGINILFGRGCCRNASAFVTDVFSELNELCENLYVTMLYEKDRDTALSSKANHMINVINYNGIPYGFDSMYNTGSFYYFINSFELFPINPNDEIYMHYKPYMHMIYQNKGIKDVKEDLKRYKQLGNKTISYDEILSILKESDVTLVENMDLVRDFVSDNSVFLEEFNEKIKVIEKKQ